MASRGYCFIANVDRLPVEKAVPNVDPVPAIAGRNRLPARLGRLIGRDQTVSMILAQLSEGRLVSIVGPGGAGKTVVAVAVAHASTQRFVGEVFHVDLGSLPESRLVPAAVASSLGCMSLSHNLSTALLAYLKDKRLLLILDNCEAVRGAIAELASRIVDTAPGVHILITSREALRVEGEHVHVLASLDSPPEKGDLTAAEALRYPATQLFMECAVAGGYRLGLSDLDAPVVAEICRKMDGIGLAIELAASRACAYGIPATARLLNDRFGLAWTGRRTAEARHQTLASMLDWSYTLLSDRERRVLCSLSVFVPDFTLESACAVAAEEDGNEILADVISELVAKSLVSIESKGKVNHYRLLDVTRTYALAKLRERGEKHDVCRKHAIHLCQLLNQDETAQFIADEDDFSQYSSHVSNILAALDWSLSGNGDRTIGVQLAASASPLLIRLSLLDECRRYGEKALAALQEEDRGSRSEMMLQQAVAFASMFTKQNSGDVRAALERGLALATAFNDSTWQLHFFAGLNAYFYRIGDFRGALAIARHASAVAEEAKNGPGLIIAEWMLGVAHHCVGNQADAERHCQRGMI